MNLVIKKYNSYVKTFEKALGKGPSYTKELNLLGRKLFGKRFRGVFPKDEQPVLKRGESLIYNLDKKGEPGSHWVAKYHTGQKNFIYDSFGRKLAKGKNEINSDLDAEQKKSENNCGPRCLAWLMCVYQFGIRLALEI